MNLTPTFSIFFYKKLHIWGTNRDKCKDYNKNIYLLFIEPFIKMNIGPIIIISITQSIMTTY